ncbi:TlpA family protein disulfide reductase [Kangiella koreensis]|uniref:TlpA family protein disulfide reductase n=1 Tax=Kangiella koreensis TaxID=261964 RepID=UPI00019E7551|nr:TlpA disulfide reductase family protein [Kangiella koreensis]
MKQLLFSSISILFLAGCASIQAPSSSDTQPVTTKPKYETYVQVGQLMPLKTVTTIDGKSIDLTNPEKRKLVILFATWCSDSQRAMKALHESDILNQEDLQIVAIARENTVEEIKKFRQERNITIDLVADVDRSIYKQFASAGIPRFILVDKNNRIVNEVLAEGENQIELIQW